MNEIDAIINKDVRKYPSIPEMPENLIIKYHEELKVIAEKQGASRKTVADDISLTEEEKTQKFQELNKSDAIELTALVESYLNGSKD